MVVAVRGGVGGKDWPGHAPTAHTPAPQETHTRCSSTHLCLQQLHLQGRPRLALCKQVLPGPTPGAAAHTCVCSNCISRVALASRSASRSCRSLLPYAVIASSLMRVHLKFLQPGCSACCAVLCCAALALALPDWVCSMLQQATPTERNASTTTNQPTPAYAPSPLRAAQTPEPSARCLAPWLEAHQPTGQHALANAGGVQRVQGPTHFDCSESATFRASSIEMISGGRSSPYMLAVLPALPVLATLTALTCAFVRARTRACVCVCMCVCTCAFMCVTHVQIHRSRWVGRAREPVAVLMSCGRGVGV